MQIEHTDPSASLITASRPWPWHSWRQTCAFDNVQAQSSTVLRGHRRFRVSSPTMSAARLLLKRPGQPDRVLEKVGHRPPGGPTPSRRTPATGHRARTAAPSPSLVRGRRPWVCRASNRMHRRAPSAGSSRRAWCPRATLRTPGTGRSDAMSPAVARCCSLSGVRRGPSRQPVANTSSVPIADRHGLTRT